MKNYSIWSRSYIWISMVANRLNATVEQKRIGKDVFYRAVW